MKIGTQVRHQPIKSGLRGSFGLLPRLKGCVFGLVIEPGKTNRPAGFLVIEPGKPPLHLNLSQSGSTPLLALPEASVEISFESVKSGPDLPPAGSLLFTEVEPCIVGLVGDTDDKFEACFGLETGDQIHPQTKPYIFVTDWKIVIESNTTKQTIVAIKAVP